MAREIRGVSSTGTLYARIMNPAGLWWNGSSFEAYSTGNYATYDVAMTEQGDSGVYVADFPAAITTGGTYEYYVHRQAGGTPAEGDTVLNTGTVDWTGTQAVTAAAGSMSGSEFRDYVLRKGFKRTDKDTELYEAATDAVQKLRRRFAFDEAEADTTTTDTISVLGDFRLNIESDLGLLIGLIVQDGVNADPLTRKTKAAFDVLYPDIYVTADRGYPTHYCVYAGQIYVGPVPDQTTYIYRLNYSKRGGAVVSGTTAVPFTDLYRDMLANLTLALLYEGLDDREAAQYYMGRFEEEYVEATRRESFNAGATVFSVVPHDF